MLDQASQTLDDNEPLGCEVSKRMRERKARRHARETNELTIENQVCDCSRWLSLRVHRHNF